MAGSTSIAPWSPPVVPLGTEVVTVFVGPEQQKFGVHKDLICASSKFFNSAFNGGYQETTSGEIQLRGLDAKLFGFFYRWLYSPVRRVGEVTYQRAQDAQLQPDELLLHIYRLAGYLVVPGLQLLAIEQLKDTFSSFEPTIPSREFIYGVFEDDQQKFMQSYLVKHIVFWISKSEDKDAWVELFTVHQKIAMGMAVEFATLETTHIDALKVIHPSKIPDFESTLFLDLPALQAEARANDVLPVEFSSGKVLGKSLLITGSIHSLILASPSEDPRSFQTPLAPTRVACQ
ncbi:hypothetical protein G647_02399 [Cladophialophora carrionii CBS 160.54]|uniref:BTB domain-containing protein n=1 Tax=Cladophialophora carrionii CBS 160.54 TaxID=1279043 RepID=V9DFI6_9EURO|nr:uncharacterized protein G647_02399 [Cladophialophora carrionii CBS 160.54]ETI25625.1 hypothetical protein G647_02399 [Cladophialophora carrionii CBS 160.54]